MDSTLNCTIAGVSILFKIQFENGNLKAFLENVLLQCIFATNCDKIMLTKTYYSMLSCMYRAISIHTCN